MEQIKNEKTFFHVFPTLKVEEEFKVLFADVEVKKITTNSGRDFLHVHLKSHHLIPKKKIWQMEQRIKEQLFGTSSVKLQILEEYELSELYTPETVMEEYKEGKLHSGSKKGPKVRKLSQARAIAFSEDRRADKTAKKSKK